MPRSDCLAIASLFHAGRCHTRCRFVGLRLPRPCLGARPDVGRCGLEAYALRHRRRSPLTCGACRRRRRPSITDLRPQRLSGAPIKVQCAAAPSPAIASSTAECPLRSRLRSTLKQSFAAARLGWRRGIEKASITICEGEAAMVRPSPAKSALGILTRLPDLPGAEQQHRIDR